MLRKAAGVAGRAAGGCAGLARCRRRPALPSALPCPARSPLDRPQVSLMVHPDKCKHPRAKDAFEVIGAAQKALLDEEQRTKLAFLLSHAKGAAPGCCSRVAGTAAATPCSPPPPAVCTLCLPHHHHHQQTR